MRVSRRGFLTGASLAATAAMAGCSPGGSSNGKADYIFRGGSVLPVAGGAPEVEALAVAGGRILAVGSEADVLGLRGSATKTVDLAGRTLLPAFVEAHSHPSQIASALAPPAVDVRPFTVPTGAQVWSALADTVATTPKGTPILLYGIDILLQPGLELPTRQQLDQRAPDNPVVIVANSGHAAYANSAALRQAGITADTPDPAGGKYGRDADGQLTGEAAETPAILALVAPYEKVLAPKMTDNMRWAYGQLARAGIATCSEHTYSATLAELYETISGEADCKLRVRGYEIGTPELASKAQHLGGGYSGGDQLFAQIGMKLWADGSPWQGNIDTTFPYLTDETTARMGLGPDHHGGMNYTPEQFDRLAQAFIAQRWQLSTHVHGDAAIDSVLDAYERALAASPIADARLRLEHVGAMRPDQFARAARMGVTTSLFIEHVYYWGDVLVDELFGPEYGGHWMSAKAALDAGVRISFHNDGTVTPPDPIGNIATAVTRTARGSGQVLAPEQRIGVDEALRAQTIDAAWQLHLDRDTGSLEQGKFADLVVLSGNPRSTPPEQLRELKVEATYLMGRQTFGEPLA
ncbi:amidohydrolase [Nocardia huaxiensis]|uniref:amidohydrolase n=1 Tax=Nocardia huaxiensis TaxID=2755382 RepID=UPI001E2CB3EC|nr:amidohydrolase [Nocardia huaxiensis]UFS95911.1 amidohydrolase [Nocardia huaxiensis]